MCGAIPPFAQYAFMAWCSVKAQGQLYLYLDISLNIYHITKFFWTKGADLNVVCILRHESFVCTKRFLLKKL
jgi:hypothetical protein